MLSEDENLLLSKLRVQRVLCFIVACVCLFLSMGELIAFNAPVRGSGVVDVPNLFTLDVSHSSMLYICLTIEILCLLYIVKSSKAITALIDKSNT